MNTFYRKLTTGRALSLCFFLSVIFIPCASATVVNFDAIDTSGGAVSGAPVASYLAGYGIAYTEGSGTTLIVGPVAPWANSPSTPNDLMMPGNQVSTYTLYFNQPVKELGFARVGVNGASSMGSWIATAYSPENDVLGVASEGLTIGTPWTWIDLPGTGIDHVTFSSDHLGWAGTHLQIDDLTFTPVPEPGTLILLGSGLVGLIVYRRKRLPKVPFMGTKA
jgi:hypothetical protein